MKQKIRGIAMVAGKVDGKGNILTLEALKEMVEKFKGCEVGYEFNPHIPHFGRATKATIEGDKLIIEAEIETKPFLENLAIVPAFNILHKHKEGAVTVIDQAEFIEMSLTSQPSDEEATRMPL